jgi:hypothetical protein
MWDQIYQEPKIVLKPSEPEPYPYRALIDVCLSAGLGFVAGHQISDSFLTALVCGFGTGVLWFWGFLTAMHYVHTPKRT